MHILILGAAGMLGRKLGAAITAGALPFTRLTLADVVAPAPVTGATVKVLNLADPGAAAEAVRDRPDLIFHLAAVVSGEAEADLAKGYAVNLDASRALFDAIAGLPDYCPRLVFASSLAVFGAPFPKVIPDDFHLTPHTSYGTQKAMTELLLSDYSRRGLVDGVALRLPTICIRPGAPNRAASGFYSSILREPLNGQPATLPVRDSLRHWFASPRAATGFFLQAARLDTGLLGPSRALSMPGLSASIAEMIEALRRVAGQEAVDLIRHEPDPVIQAIVEPWAEACEARTARDLGFTAEESFDEIIRIYLEDDHPSRPQA
ncbi:D-erythronate dehydrogenase [Tabrizicola flagellatus]|uniref:D-erythronate dehydrogenase n=1 Tax=Tabrizicola flagellatus TaxID=2593021 RepID=UPI0011F14235|nr:D-erythronate dehydrogenase [Tabrizicola flagellatus]